MTKIKYLVLFACLWGLPIGCDNDAIEKDLTEIAVVSDIHYYDPQLGLKSIYLDEVISKERKMLVESDAILRSVVDNLATDETLEFVLIPGDLTKDGAKQSHQKAAALLTQIEAAGKKVYVIPGNHDVDNPAALSYPPVGEPVPVERISAADFEDIYKEFGFSEALDRDPHSLSYLVQPKEGLWLLGLDSCIYGDGIFHVGGAFSTKTLNWVTAKVAAAKQNEIAIIGMAHHGIVEHFPNMDIVFGDFLVNDWRHVAGYFADIGLKIIFTGHNHANDIARFEKEGNVIFDVQTGSTVSWPNTYRRGNIDMAGHEISFNPISLETIPFDMGGLDYNSYAYAAFTNGFSEVVIGYLMGAGVDADTAKLVEPVVTPTLIAYYEGDESTKQNDTTIQQIQAIMAFGGEDAELLGNLLLGIWEDDTPDNIETLSF